MKDPAQERLPRPEALHEGYPLEVATPDDLLDELRDLRHIDPHQLLAMGVSHRSLPKEDPVRFVISHHSEEADRGTPSPYSFGVMVGRALLPSQHDRHSPLLPLIISDAAPETKQRVSDFLNDETIESQAVIEEVDPKLQSRLELFFGLLELVSSELMHDENSATSIRRGLYDYLVSVALIVEPNLLQSVAAIPEKPHNKARLLHRRRGKVGKLATESTFS